MSSRTHPSSAPQMSRDSDRARADRGLRVARRHPNCGAGRLDGSIDWLCLPASMVSRCSVACRRTGRGQLPPGPRPARPRADPRHGRHRHPRDDLGSRCGASDLTEGMVAEVSGQLLPSTMLVLRLTAKGGPCRQHLRSTPPRRPAPEPEGPRRSRPGPQPVHRRHRVAGDPRRVHRPGLPRRSSSHLMDFTAVMTTADREPLVYVDPQAAWDALDTRRAALAVLVPKHPPDTSTLFDVAVRSPPTPASKPQPTVGSPGCRPYDLAARLTRRGAQLGLLLRLASRCQHRHRRLPRRWQRGRGPGVHGA